MSIIGMLSSGVPINPADRLVLSNYSPQSVSSAIDISFGPLGNLTITAESGTENPGEWFNNWPSTAYGDDYEVQLTVTSGTSPASGPAVSTYHTISSTRTWQMAADEGGTWTIDVREIAVPGNIVTGVFTISTI